MLRGLWWNIFFEFRAAEKVRLSLSREPVRIRLSRFLPWMVALVRHTRTICPGSPKGSTVCASVVREFSVEHLQIASLADTSCFLCIGTTIRLDTYSVSAVAWWADKR